MNPEPMYQFTADELDRLGTIEKLADALAEEALRGNDISLLYQLAKQLKAKIAR